MNDAKTLFNRTTDPKYTKNVSVGGKPSFTNIDTYYLIKEASIEFGIFGETWGIKGTEYEYREIGETTLVILHAEFFFPGGSFPITHSGRLVYKAKSGYQIIDEDIFKKLETNIIAKSLSRIGFGTDVYTGRFEDAQYVGEAFSAHEKISFEQTNKIMKGLAYYGVESKELIKEFGLSVVKDLSSSDFEKAQAFIKAIATKNIEK